MQWFTFVGVVFNAIYFSKETYQALGGNKYLQNMTKQELERYLEIEQVLAQYGVVVKSDGQLDCPFHRECKGSMQLYKELNGVACTRSSCTEYRKVFTAFELLRKLEGCNLETARLYGKSILLEELEELREEKVKRLSLRSLSSEVLANGKSEILSFWTRLQAYLSMQALPMYEYEFSQSELRRALKLNKSTLQRYLDELLMKDYVEQVSDNKARGYTYRAKKG